MKLSPSMTDNITEVLVKIIEFTQARQDILISNVNNAGEPEFVPEDLMVEEFSILLSGAIDEHINNQRLVLYDTEHIKFGSGGNFEVKPVVDGYAAELLESSSDEYLELQIDKLVENSLNLRIASELLRQKQAMASICE
ncbi:MAG: hypothetical protein KAS69_03815 [Planctomycetes bacterium]|nr:hypothetical protein [Planctomycetota bacterium]